MRLQIPLLNLFTPSFINKQQIDTMTVINSIRWVSRRQSERFKIKDLHLYKRKNGKGVKNTNFAFIQNEKEIGKKKYKFSYEIVSFTRFHNFYSKK